MDFLLRIFCCDGICRKRDERREDVDSLAVLGHGGFRSWRRVGWWWGRHGVGEGCQGRESCNRGNRAVVVAIERVLAGSS